MAKRIKDGSLIIKVQSHRALNKLHKLLQRKPQSYFSFYRNGYWYEVTPVELEKVKAAKIKGITQSSWHEDLQKTIEWG